jgi:hypothetical protein
MVKCKHLHLFKHNVSTDTGAVYHLHGKPIQFEIVLMVSKISDKKSHSDYALSHLE